MHPSTSANEPLGPSKGRVRRPRWRAAQRVHARLSSSSDSVSNDLKGEDRLLVGSLLELNWKDKEGKWVWKLGNF
jgi:hypothetical protein